MKITTQSEFRKKMMRSSTQQHARKISSDKLGSEKFHTLWRLNESKAEEGKQGISTQESCWTGNRW